MRSWQELWNNDDKGRDFVPHDICGNMQIKLGGKKDKGRDYFKIQKSAKVRSHRGDSMLYMMKRTASNKEFI